MGNGAAYGYRYNNFNNQMWDESFAVAVALVTFITYNNFNNQMWDEREEESLKGLHKKCSQY